MSNLESLLSEQLPTLENSNISIIKKYYSEIELTEEEEIEAINEAKEKKYKALARIKAQDDYRRFIDSLKTPFTIEELYKHGASRMRVEYGIQKLQFETDELKHLVKALCFYFTNNPEFEKMGDGWKLNKGLLLMGNVGTGKTTIMRMFAENKRLSYRIAKCRDIANDYAESGHDIIKKYSDVARPRVDEYKYFLQDRIGYMFDDLGTEDIKKNYGNTVNVMENILLNRYDCSSYGYEFTHITTNLTADQLEVMYGQRVRSRMREMFNPISLTGEDMRK